VGPCRAILLTSYVPTLILTLLLCRLGVARTKSNPRTDFPLLSHLICGTGTARGTTQLTATEILRRSPWLVGLHRHTTNSHPMQEDRHTLAHAHACIKTALSAVPPSHLFAQFEVQTSRSRIISGLFKWPPGVSCGWRWVALMTASRRRLGAGLF
jgi:hypothetical protein